MDGVGSARAARTAIRNGTRRTPTAGVAPDFVQANLVVVPSRDAEDMRMLCRRNPVPCPVVEELPPGSFTPRTAPGADLRTDVGAYRLWRNGEITERRSDVLDLWNDDMVAFLIGCSFTFERALVDEGLEIRHIACGTNVPMYRTSLRLLPAGKLHGHMVVSMRPFKERDVERVRTITRPYVEAHGEPVHWGDPATIGIVDIESPDEGEAIPLERDDVPVFWGCGVTPQLVALESRLPFVITHEPGYMFVSDLRHEDMLV